MSANLLNAENNPNISHWYIDGGYDAEVDGGKYPKHISNALPLGAFYIKLKHYTSNSKFKRFNVKSSSRIFLHMQGEIPAVNRFYFQSYPAENILISINPTLTFTSRKLHSYTPDNRQCFFNIERRLQFFKIYTQRNCEEECFSNYMKTKCGCVRFNMPSI